jgi:hypothetical protein
LVVTAVALVAGCGAGAGGGDDAGSGGGTSDSGGDTASDSGTGAGGGDTENESTGPDICAQDIRDDVEDTVRGQTRAISARDYVKALEYSSERYRSSTTPEIFGALIESSYDYLITTSDYEFSDCYVYDDPELEVVTITAQYGDVDLAYYLVEEDEAWRIDLAGAPSVASEAQPAV